MSNDNNLAETAQEPNHPNLGSPESEPPPVWSTTPINPASTLFPSPTSHNWLTQDFLNSPLDYCPELDANWDRIVQPGRYDVQCLVVHDNFAAVPKTTQFGEKRSYFEVRFGVRLEAGPDVSGLGNILLVSVTTLKPWKGNDSATAFLTAIGRLELIPAQARNGRRIASEVANAVSQGVRLMVEIGWRGDDFDLPPRRRVRSASDFPMDHLSGRRVPRVVREEREVNAVSVAIGWLPSGSAERGLA